MLYHPTDISFLVKNAKYNADTRQLTMVYSSPFLPHFPPSLTRAVQLIICHSSEAAFCTPPMPVDKLIVTFGRTKCKGSHRNEQHNARAVEVPQCRDHPKPGMQGRSQEEDSGGIEAETPLSRPWSLKYEFIFCCAVIPFFQETVL